LTRTSADGGDRLGSAAAAAGPGRLRESGLLREYGLPAEAAVARSTVRFPDGAHYRIEIPSVEGPRVLREVLRAASSCGLTVNRVSQGSGAMLLSHAELREMARIGADAALEVSLFVGPREEYSIGNQSRSPEGAALAGQLRGVRQLRYAVEDVLRAVDCGIRGFLVADVGLLRVLNVMQKDGQLPPDIVWKISVLLAPSNPATLGVLAEMGASTVNVPSDMTLDQLSEMRAATDLPLDLYVESPDATGGVVRGAESADLVRVAAPLYVKFGLRNSRSLYPSGEHLVEEAMKIAREKVHRAAVATEWIRRLGPELEQSKAGAAGLGVPQP
jgi:Peptidase family U32